MIPDKIKTLGMKHVAVMSVHNTEDFFGKFDGVMICEQPINPTGHGLTLFNWNLHQRTLPSGVDPLVAEVIYFYGLNQLVGIDAIVVHDKRLENNVQNSLYIAHQVRLLMPETKILMYTTEDNLSDVSILSSTQPSFNLPPSYTFYAAANAACIETAGKITQYRCVIPEYIDAISNNPLAICDLLGIDRAAKKDFDGIWGAAAMTEIYLQALPSLGHPNQVYDTGLSAAAKNGINLLESLPRFHSIEWSLGMFRKPGLTY